MLVWIRVGGLALLIAGVLSAGFIPTWGRHIAFVSFVLVIGGTAGFNAGTRRKNSRDSVSGGPYGDASGLDMNSGGHYHPDGHDGGHGGDSGDGGGH